MRKITVTVPFCFTSSVLQRKVGYSMNNKKNARLFVGCTLLVILALFRHPVQKSTIIVASEISALQQDAPTVLHQPSLTKRVREVDLMMEGLHRRANRPGRTPIQGCFVTMIKHDEEGIRKFHRLIVNVRQKLPLMATRYPYLAFHEAKVLGSTLGVSLLRNELQLRTSGDTMDGLLDPIDSVSADRTSFNDLRSVHSLSPELLHFLDDEPISHIQLVMDKFLYPAAGGGGSWMEFVSMKHDDFSVPPFVDEHVTWPYPQHSYWGVSYRHMCRFFAFRLFQYLLAHRVMFDYYLRLDSDSFILSTPLAVYAPWASANIGPKGVQWEPDHEKNPREIDLFEAMLTKGAKYGFSMLHPQTERTFFSNLWNHFDDFVADIGEPPRSPLPFDRNLMVHYWDNFEVVDLSLLRRFDNCSVAGRQVSLQQWMLCQGGAFHTVLVVDHNVNKMKIESQLASHNKDVEVVNRFLEHLDHKGGVYYHRWGDAEIRTLTISLAVQPTQIVQFDSLGYQHYHNFHCAVGDTQCLHLASKSNVA